DHHQVGLEHLAVLVDEDSSLIAGIPGHGQVDAGESPAPAGPLVQEDLDEGRIAMKGNGIAQEQHPVDVARLGSDDLTATKAERVDVWTAWRQLPEELRVRHKGLELRGPRIPELDAGLVAEVDLTQQELRREEQDVDHRQRQNPRSAQ